MDDAVLDRSMLQLRQEHREVNTATLGISRKPTTLRLLLQLGTASTPLSFTLLEKERL